MTEIELRADDRMRKGLPWFLIKAHVPRLLFTDARGAFVHQSTLINRWSYRLAVAWRIRGKNLMDDEG